LFFRRKPSEWQDFKKGLLKSYVSDFELKELFKGLDYLRSAELDALLLKKIKHLKFFA